MRKFQETFNALTEVRALLRGREVRSVKKILGDSTKNNRTLTVAQTVRFLNKTGAHNLAKRLNVVSSILKPQILKRRKNRTDAIDINELVSVYRTVVMNGRSDVYRKRIGTAVSKVG